VIAVRENQDHRPPRHQPARFAPGDWVRLPSEPGWGLGQVQSAAGARITVNFEHAGKRALNAEHVVLEPVADP
jgi:hypothetical protein